MSTSFPLSLDSFTNPLGSESLAGHASQHANANDAIEALQAKVGIDSSTDPNSISYRLAAIAPRITASQNISGHTAVALDATGGAIPADAATATHSAVLGIATGAAMTGADVTILSHGAFEHLGWTFTPGLPVFLGLAGALTQTVPPTALFSKVLGMAVTPTRISVDFQPAIFL